MTDEQIEIVPANHSYIEIDSRAVYVDTDTTNYDNDADEYPLSEWDAKLVLTRKPAPIFPAGTVIRGKAVGHYVKRTDQKWHYVPDERLGSVDPNNARGDVVSESDQTMQILGTVVYQPDDK